MMEIERFTCLVQQNWGSYPIFAFADFNCLNSIFLSKQHSGNQMVKDGGTTCRYYEYIGISAFALTFLVLLW